MADQTPTPTSSRIDGFPACRLESARRALELAHRRLVRGAQRAGQEAPVAPVLTVVRERVESICTGCRVVMHGFAGGTCMACRNGYMVARQVVDLELVAPRPALGGWEFLAVIEPLDGGNLLRKVPGACISDGELAPWRAGKIGCDHCRASRRRAETFILRADGSDPEVAAGTYRQVGRNCLKVFLGGKSAAAIIAALGWDELVRNEGGDEGGGGSWGGPAIYDPETFMAWTAATVRLDGWVSKGAARDRGVQATADVVRYLLDPPFGGHQAREAWNQARKAHEPTDDDRARGAAALAWAKELAGKTDYEENLALVARQTYVRPQHAGILASAVSAHARRLGEEAKRAARAASAHLGSVGEKKHNFGLVTIERVTAIDTSYGTLFINAFRDSVGNAIVWRTRRSCGAPGDAVVLVGTVKAHGEYRGEAQTEVARCNVTPPEGATSAAGAAETAS